MISINALGGRRGKRGVIKEFYHAWSAERPLKHQKQGEKSNVRSKMRAEGFAKDKGGVRIPAASAESSDPEKCAL